MRVMRRQHVQLAEARVYFVWIIAFDRQHNWIHKVEQLESSAWRQTGATLCVDWRST